jgi:hypothetical protein
MPDHEVDGRLGDSQGKSPSRNFHLTGCLDSPEIFFHNFVSPSWSSFSKWRRALHLKDAQPFSLFNKKPQRPYMRNTSIKLKPPRRIAKPTHTDEGDAYEQGLYPDNTPTRFI